MNFSEATNLLKEGHGIRRKSWPEFVYIGWHYVVDDEGFELPPELAEYRQETIPFLYRNDIIISEDWEIIGEEGTTFNFSEAVEAMMRRYKIRLSSWEKNTWIQLSENTRDIIMKRM